MGKAVITAEDASLFLPKIAFKETIGFLAALARSDSRAALELVSGLEEQGINFTFFTDNCLEYARQMLLFSATGNAERLALYFSSDEMKEIQALASEAGQNRVREITVELLKASRDLSLAPDMPSLALELATVLLCAEKQADAPESRATMSSRAPARDMDSQPLKKELPILAVPSTPVLSNAEPTHSLEEILDGWGEVLAKARNKNHALNFVLGVAEPIGVSGNTLELGVKYRLQQEKVLELKNRETVETIIKEVYGTSYRIAPTVQERIKPKKEPIAQDDLVKAALEVFKGAELLN